MRALHRWFKWFVPVCPPISRVIAVAAGAAMTAGILGVATWSAVSAMGSHVSPTLAIVVQLPLATAAWALLGKVEGDERDRQLPRGDTPWGGSAVPRHPGPEPYGSSGAQAAAPGWAPLRHR
jgi:hypothetical protein